MIDAPLCQFGPGGDYVYPWPDSERAYVTASDGMQSESVVLNTARAGAEAPLVRLGPDSLRWTEDVPAAPAAVGGLAYFMPDAELEPEGSSGIFGRALAALGRMFIGDDLPPKPVLAAGSVPIENV
ncbi:MAG: hypothetical protein GY794_05550, partial [bacterium]|nr:hypothetical protein [bacterium]